DVAGVTLPSPKSRHSLLGTGSRHGESAHAKDRPSLDNSPAHSQAPSTREDPLRTLGEGNNLAFFRSVIDLSRPATPLGFGLMHLDPVGQPAGKSSDRE